MRHFHYHCCVLDGVFALDATGAVRFPIKYLYWQGL